MAPKDLTALGLAAPDQALLNQYGFDLEAFTHLQGELRAGRFGPERNRAAGSITAPDKGDITPWPQAGGGQTAALTAAGHKAIDAGQVAVAILNGGMATRFGGRVKGVVEVVDGLSFLALKLRNIAATSAKAPVFLMNSFATDRDTRAHLQEHRYFGLDPTRVHIVTQRISVRLTPAGEVFRDAQGAVSLYAPGHGDLLEALDGAAAFRAFRAAGGKLVAVSNVDNLGATLEPRVLGAHLASGREVTCEVASREGGDTGGAPVRRDGKLEVLEGFRFPADFPTDTLPVFNTNTFVMHASAVHAHPLTWFRADKKVGDSPVVQFERLLGEVTSFVPSAYLEVPRQGPEGRFLPVKTPQDIEAVRPLVRVRFAL